MTDHPPPADDGECSPFRQVPEGFAPDDSPWWDAPEWPADVGATVAQEGRRGDPPAIDVEHSPRAEARRHRTVLAASCAAIALAFAMVEVPEGRIAFRGLTDRPLPHTCASRALLGWSCPGCGLTRSIIHLAEGDWPSSWRSHRLGSVMAALIVLQVPYRLVAMRRPGRPPIPGGWRNLAAAALVALLLLNWLAEVVRARVGSV